MTIIQEFYDIRGLYIVINLSWSPRKTRGLHYERTYRIFSGLQEKKIVFETAFAISLILINLSNNDRGSRQTAYDGGLKSS